MAETAAIGELFVRIGGSSDGLSDAAKRGSAALKDFSGVADTAQRAHAAAARSIVNVYTVAAAAVTAAVHQAMSEAQQLANLSQITGTTTGELQRLSYAVKSTGGSMADVSAAVKSYGETVNEMAINPTSKAAQAFKMMGVEVRDAATGQMRNFTAVLMDVADRFAAYGNGAQKAALANALFKGQADALLPLLNRGSAGIRELGAEAERLGIVFDSATIKKMDLANREVTKFTSAMTKLGGELAAGVLPAITSLVGYITFLVQKFNELNDPIGKTEKSIAAVNAEIERLQRGDLTWYEKQFVNVKDAIEVQRDLLAKLNADLKEYRANAPKPLEVDIRKTDVWNTRVETPDLNALQTMKDELDDFMNRLSGLPVLMGESFALDARPFEEGMKRVNQAEAEGAISAREANRIRLQLKKTEQDAMLETASMAASTISAVFKNNKAAGIATAVINTAVGVTKALSGSIPPWSFIQAGLVAAAGAAQIAAISSASENGGGSVASVSGGAAAAAPPPPQAQQEQTLRVEGFKSSEFYSGDAVRTIAQRLIDYQRDGGKVILT